MKQSVTTLIFFGGRFGGNTTLLVKKNADEKTHLPGYDLRNGGFLEPLGNLVLFSLKLENRLAQQRNISYTVTRKLT